MMGYGFDSLQLFFAYSKNQPNSIGQAKVPAYLIKLEATDSEISVLFLTQWIM